MGGIAERILIKIDKDWDELLNENDTEMYTNEEMKVWDDLKIKVTNADVESTFAYLKNSKEDGNTTAEVRALRAEFAYNRTLEWLLEHPNKIEIIEEASTKANREEERRKSSEINKEHIESVARLQLQPASTSRVLTEQKRKERKRKAKK